MKVCSFFPLLALVFSNMACNWEDMPLKHLCTRVYNYLLSALGNKPSIIMRANSSVIEHHVVKIDQLVDRTHLDSQMSQGASEKKKKREKEKLPGK